MKNMILTISGYSNSGKSTLENMLVTKYPNIFTKIVSHTTRKKRYNENNGESYYFVDDNEFNQTEMIEEVKFDNNRYGCSTKEIKKAFDENKIPVIVVTPDGTLQISNKSKEYNWRLISLFISAPHKLLISRMMERYASDVLSTPDIKNDKITDLSNIYSSRILSMFSEENTWMNYFNYTKIFTEFSKNTEEKVIKNILETLNK
jgi:guanylate kinase